MLHRSGFLVHHWRASAGEQSVDLRRDHLLDGGEGG
jgi:hypothetical protein